MSSSVNLQFEKTDAQVLPKIAELNREIFAGMYEQEPYGLAIFQKRLQDKDPVIFVAKDNGQLVGYSISFPKENYLYLWILGVKKDYRGQGIASALVEKNEAEARGFGYVGVTVKTYNISHEMLQLLISRKYLIVNVETSSSSSLYNAVYLELKF